MRRVFYVWFVLICAIGLAYSQEPEGLTRNVLVILDANETVNPGEFQMELQKGGFFNENTDNPWFSFVYTTANKFTGNDKIMVNNQVRFPNAMIKVRTYKIGPTLEDCIFVVKGVENGIKLNMEMVVAHGIKNPVCDSVLYLDDDGYVFSMDDHVYYRPYLSVKDNQPKVDQVVWLRKKTHKSGRTFASPQKAEAFARLSDGDVYYECTEGHYYYLYRDKYMPYTVMVLDDKVYELHDVYDYDDFRLKFSYNGKHWMAVGKQCFWVDGKLRSIEGFGIVDFMITNKGEYGYIANKLNEAEKGDVVVYKGQVIRRNADVCYFGINKEGSLKFRFLAGGRCMQYENDSIFNMTGALTSVCYPNDKKDRLVCVYSNDGNHKLKYRRGVPSVEIDGVKVTGSEPCFAIYDPNNNVFVWNAIETRNLKTELVIYRYAIKKNKKLFR